MSNRTIGNQPKAIALLLVLALALIIPAAALAAAGGTDRPIQGTMSGTISINPTTGAIIGDATGENSHLGESTLHFEGTVQPTGEDTYAGTAAVTLVADNGDRLTGIADVTTTGLTTTTVVEITGGTGRFADASGTLTVTCLYGPPQVVGDLLVSAIDCEATGQISY